ncbi:MAG: hypothetical protein IKF72_00720 [Kiritimatiellae bacterium]|nr:hypothetical protein [Kiritimatiellia bacterium]
MKRKRWKFFVVKALRKMRLIGGKRCKDLMDYLVVESSPLFDGKWYLQHNKDVARKRVDPVWHYLHRGWKKGLNPGPKFCGKVYVAMYPDVARAGVAPLLHYERCGRREGRRIKKRPNETSVARKPISIAEDLPFSDDLIGQIHQNVLQGLYGCGVEK